jgi:MoaA/NifB/PqqE/SkfB family radical SAM enzyme
MTEDNNHPNSIQVDSQGRLIIPPGLASLYAIKPGDKIGINRTPDGLSLRLPSRLNKLYIEPTNQCNLDCVTCVRHNWREPMGMMSGAVWARLAEGLRSITPPPTVFFGGFGEPLFHPDIVGMVAEARAAGARVELITNATLLTPALSRELINAGLGLLWVSLDGASPESYADIRLGASLPRIIENLGHFQKASYEGGCLGGCCGEPLARAGLGIVFVAMKRNIHDLPEVIKIGQRFGADNFMVTNVLPYTREMVDETLYHRVMINNNYHKQLSLPILDLDDKTYGPLFQTLRNMNGTWSGVFSDNTGNRCPFIEKGAGAIRWDGSFSPCLPLMHSHTSYLGFLEYGQRSSRAWSVGNVLEHSLAELWNMPEHLAFREKVQAFDFAPCTSCGSCDLIEHNDEDCLVNAFPTCGGCLWAQGVVQCP